LTKSAGDFKVKVKSEQILGDYICLHGLVPNNELPKKLRGKIPKNEIWIREDVWNDRLRRNAVIIHEKAELSRMVNKGMTYKKAHKWAEGIDGCW
jgi:hypothetical protein